MQSKMGEDQKETKIEEELRRMERKEVELIVKTCKWTLPKLSYVPDILNPWS